MSVLLLLAYFLIGIGLSLLWGWKVGFEDWNLTNEPPWLLMSVLLAWPAVVVLLFLGWIVSMVMKLIKVARRFHK